MLKYIDTKVTFSEVPDEISLCINISNCPCHCEGCHSSYLAEDKGTLLDEDSLDLLIKGNKGITCIAFMGGDSNPKEVNRLAAYIKKYYPNIKTAWYSGRESIHTSIKVVNFNFIKIGPYIEKYGPLNKDTTNQVFYKVVVTSAGIGKLFDITYKFWKND